MQRDAVAWAIKFVHLPNLAAILDRATGTEWRAK
jgi:hypothetical protein